jgi:HlyD family secretion protein
MKRALRWCLLLLILGGVAFFVWHRTRPEPVKVAVSPVARGNVQRTVANTRAGTVKACRRAKLSPSIGGQIARLAVREGDRVRRGQLLIELWNDDLAAELRLAEREADAAASRADAACFNAEEAQREAARQETLFQKGAAAAERRDAASTSAKALQAECQAARVSVQAVQARAGVVREQLVRTRLYAPFDGVIGAVNGELNEYLTPSPPGIPTLPAVDLIDDSCFYVSAPIDEVDAASIVPGMRAVISLDAFGDRRFPGKVRRVAPYVLEVEKQARTVSVEVSFEKAEGVSVLLAGYSADVEIILEERPDTLRIPTEAVLDGRRVFVYRPEKRMIEERVLRKGISNWSYTEVLEGLEPGDQVVVNVDQAGLKNGAQAVLREGLP